MTKKLFALSIVVVAALGSAPWGVIGVAFAQTGPGSAPAAAPAAAPSATPSAPAGAPSAAPADGAPIPAPAIDVAAARKACVAALNADPKFEAEIVKVADEKAQLLRDRQTIETHNDAFARIQKNEKHVIYAYAGMWILAAAFVLFLWRRQQALKVEIAQLRRELDAAEGKPAGRS